MKMSWFMVVEIHPNEDAIKTADGGHGQSPFGD
jgi:hypothetical protein